MIRLATPPLLCVILLLQCFAATLDSPTIEHNNSSLDEDNQPPFRTAENNDEPSISSLISTHVEDTQFLLPSNFTTLDFTITNSSEYIFAGYFSGTLILNSSHSISSHNASEDILVLKTDFNGTIIDYFHASGSGDDRIRGMDIDPFGNLYLGGYMGGNLTLGNTNYTTDDREGLVVKLDQNFSVVWSNNVTTHGNGNEISDVDWGSDDSIAIAGNCEGTKVNNVVTSISFGSTVSYNRCGTFYLSNSPLTYNGIPLGGSGTNMYVGKLNATGYWEWAKKTEGCRSGSTGCQNVGPTSRAFYLNSNSSNVWHDSEGNIVAQGSSWVSNTLNPNNWCGSGNSYARGLIFGDFAIGNSCSPGIITTKISNSGTVDLLLNIDGGVSNDFRTDGENVLDGGQLGFFMKGTALIENGQRISVTGQSCSTTSSPQYHFTWMNESLCTLDGNIRIGGGFGNQLPGDVSLTSGNSSSPQIVTAFLASGTITLGNEDIVLTTANTPIVAQINTSNTSSLYGWGWSVALPSYAGYSIGGTEISGNGDIHILFSSGRDTILRITNDSDGDGSGKYSDKFPNDNTQWSDYDNDGYGDQPTGNDPDNCVTQAGNSTIDLLGCPDYDGDGYSNQGDDFPNEITQFRDSDSDGYGDNLSGALGDACQSTYGESTRDRYGCPDSDFDGWSNQNDTFPEDSSQWADNDGDGYGDQLIGFQGDACPDTLGNSTEDRYGCPDLDGDGWSDDGDDMMFNPTQWSDRDGDGYGDNATGTMADSFPSDGTQWNDTDGDSHGDNPYGSEGDWFPNDPERWADADRDGVADEDDAFVNDATQWNDTDGDGYGDEIAGNQGDAFPEDPEEWQDSDSDGLGNNADAFPFDPSQQTDSDGDGFGDNPLGSGADKFPQDASQWSDIDGDGYGDNETGNESDAFITDATQWADRDGDGYGDNPFGNGADMFPDEETQWADEDGDGLGDNPEGKNFDPYLLDFDNDGYNDSIDILPKLASPGDLDNDGCLDEVDLFPTDYRECLDNDGDGIGDSADTDDDNDGWTDTDEIREDTDPLDPLEYPIEAFQLMVPGTTIGLDGWDLIGIFGGVPLFTWIIFGFVTRNARCRKFEKMLNGARTKKELENIALKSEHALMIRLLGPHQGIRLERLRAELDDALEGEGMPFDEDHTEVVEDEMAEVNITEEIADFDDAPHAPPAAIVAEGMADGALPESVSPPDVSAVGIVGQDGYEWLQQGGATWYRPANSGSDWTQWIQ